MNPQDTTPEAFKQRILSKYPNGVSADGRKYADMDATELTQKIVQKFPNAKTNDGIEYKSFLRATEPPKKSTLEKVGNVADTIFGGKQIGEGIGTLIARARAKPEEKQYIKGPSAKEIIGDVGRVALNFIPGGEAAGLAKGIKPLSTLAKIGKGAKIGAKFGTGIGATDALREGGDVGDVLSGGVQGAVFGGATGGVLGLAGAGLSKLGKKGIIPPEGGLTPKQNNIITKREKEIFDIENNYAKTRKANEFSKDAGSASRKRVASTDVLVDSVDENGLVRTKQPGGAIEKYKAQTIDGAEATVRENLQRLGEKVALRDVESQLTRAVHDSGLEGSDLRTALNGIKKEIAGYKLKADAQGKIPLTLVHDAKISTTRNINYLTQPEVKAYRKAIARGLKEIVENHSSFNVKEVNAELAKYYDDISLLERLDGARVKGGKLGKYFAQIAGNVAGGVAGGAVGGVPGSAIGTVVGGEVGNRIKGSLLSRTFGKMTGRTASKSRILQEAVETGKSPRLQLPAPKAGQPRIQISSGETINLPASRNKIPTKINNPKEEYMQLAAPSGKPLGTQYNPDTIKLPAKTQSSVDEAYRSRIGTQKNQYTAKPTIKPNAIPISDTISQNEPKVNNKIVSKPVGKVSNLGPMSKIGSKNKVKISYRPKKNGTIHIDKFESTEPGQGNFKNAIDDIIKYAKKNKVRITVTPGDEFGSDAKRLEKLFREKGFMDNPKINIENGKLVYDPQLSVKPPKLK